MADWLDAFPRVALGHTPTPLEPLDRLSEALGGPRLWIKRDDCTGLATGGNKTRKLEFLIADALANHANAVITFGAIQSNHARQIAAACAKFGLECHLILVRTVAWDHPEYETNANVLLDDLLGAHLHRCEPSDAKTTTQSVQQELASAGKSVYLIPTGGSNALGALGYVRCARELLEQSAALGFHADRVVHATSSGGTQAGLMVGMAEAGAAHSVLGINVYDPNHDAMEERVRSLARAVCDFRGAMDTIDTDTLQPEIDHRYLGSGYGQPTSDTTDGIRQLAELEGILVDPVYSGKALGGLIRRIRAGEESLNSNVIFVHTGGVAVEYVYRRAFERPTG